MPKNTPLPTPSFAVSTGERDGLPIVAVINAALAHYAGCGDFPWLVELEIVARDTDDRGLPTLEEVDQLNAIEERLQESLGSLGSHFIARQTWNGRRLLDFYVADGPAAQKTIDALIKQRAFPRRLTVQVSRDDDWSTWMSTLVRMCEPAAQTYAATEHSLLVRIGLGEEFGSDEEQEAVLALADALAAILANSEAGEFDGYEFGNGEAALFAYGDDADALFDALEPLLRRSVAARGALITKRYGPADDDDAREETFTL
jgi:hypothetical protein